MRQGRVMCSIISFHTRAHTQIVRGAKGFTLIEVLVALVITALVLAMVYSSYSAVMRTRERVTNATDLDMTARLVLTRMSREIETAFLVKKAPDAPPESRYTLFKGSQNDIGRRPADKISFTCFAHTKRGVDAKESDQAIISYEVQELASDEDGRDREEPTLGLIRREWRRIPPPGETQSAEPRPIPLVEDLQGFRLRFRDDEGEWQESWDSTDLRTLDQLPTAVEITLTLRDERGRDHDFVTVTSPKIKPIDRSQLAPAQGETQIESSTPPTDDSATGEPGGTP